MPTNKNYEFVILKKSYTFATCAKCNGTGIKKRTFRKMCFVEDCSDCLGKGRKRFSVNEEFSLMEALKELKLNQ